MPVKAMVAYERRVNADSVDFCEVHHEGCKKYRNPDPKIWGHPNTDGRGKVKPGWVMTPDEMLDVHLDSLAHGIDLLGGSREEFLARSCKIVQMPRAEYRKRFGNRSTEVDMGLVRLLGQGVEDHHTQDVREGYGDAVPDFEEME